MNLLAIDPAISLHRTYYGFTLPFTSCYPVNLWADIPAVLAHFFVNLLLRASQVHFSHLYLFQALLANIPAMPAYFIISFLGFPQPVYFLITSFTLMGLLLDPLGFLSPITTSLPLITSWDYWPLGRPIEFTNSFPELPCPIYLFLFSQAYYFILSASSACLLLVYRLFIVVGLLAINPIISTCWACFLIPLLFSFSHLFYIVRLLLLLGPLSKVGINRTKLPLIVTHQHSLLPSQMVTFVFP